MALSSSWGAKTSAKINNLYIALYNENDFERAKSIYNEVLTKSELTDNLELSLVQDALDSYSQMYGGLNLPKEAVSEINKKILPDDYKLLGNYPNPFNPSTTISFALPYSSSIELKIYDIMGAEVRRFAISEQQAGYQNIVWDGMNENGSPVSSEIYLYRVNIKSLKNNEMFSKTAKLMMLK